MKSCCWHQKQHQTSSRPPTHPTRWSKNPSLSTTQPNHSQRSNHDHRRHKVPKDARRTTEALRHSSDQIQQSHQHPGDKTHDQTQAEHERIRVKRIGVLANSNMSIAVRNTTGVTTRRKRHDGTFRLVESIVGDMPARHEYHYNRCLETGKHDTLREQPQQCMLWSLVVNTRNDTKPALSSHTSDTMA